VGNLRTGILRTGNLRTQFLRTQPYLRIGILRTKNLRTGNLRTRLFPTKTSFHTIKAQSFQIYLDNDKSLKQLFVQFGQIDNPTNDQFFRHLRVIQYRLNSNEFNQWDN
jgi:hypothetical protein